MRALVRRWMWGFCAAAAICATSGPVAAQQHPVRDRRAPEGNGDGMDTHLFRPAVDSKGFFYVNGSDILGANDISFGLILDYGRNIMRTRVADSPRTAAGAECADPENCAIATEGSGVDSLVDDSFQGTFGFNYGLANFATVGITIPVVLMTGDPAYQIGPDTGLYNTVKLDQQSVSSVALHGKFRLTRVDRTIGIAALIQAGVPVGDAPRDLGADPGFWYWPRLLVENHFGFSRRLKIGVDVGYRGHTGQNPRFENAVGGTQLEEGTFEYGNLATFGLGIAYRMFDSVDVVAETYGTYLLSNADSGQKHSQELLGGLKLFVERNSYLMVGGGTRHPISTGFEAADVRLVLGFVFEPSIGDRDGDGYKDDQDQCPDEPEDFDGFEDGDGCPDPDNDNDGILDVDDRCPNVPEDRDGDEDEDGCPEGEAEKDRDGDGILDSNDKCPDDPEDKDGFQDTDGCPEHDNDKDGILDKDDSCPLDPEDRDGFEDSDGCPEPDNDRDQIPDKRDKCPNEPETYNGFEDKDGCPDKGKVIIEGSDIMILEKVQFETGSARILPQSNAILDAVASALKGHPEFKVVEVAGHADERSSDEYNLKLTTERAAAVADALVKRGIRANRLVSQGYGEFCPLDEGHNNAAWEKNRRVEFKIVKTDEGSTGVERGCQRAVNKGVRPPKVP